jgi:hypothetical protein
MPSRIVTWTSRSILIAGAVLPSAAFVVDTVLDVALDAIVSPSFGFAMSIEETARNGKRYLRKTIMTTMLD